MYDMYPWHDDGPPPAPGAPAAAAPAAAPAAPAAPVPGARAVQVALDRRDNGGDAASGPAAG